METLEYEQVASSTGHPTFWVRWYDQEFEVVIEEGSGYTLKEILKERLGLEDLELVPRGSHE